MNRYEVLLDEQRFPYENMTLEERNCYLNIIRNCKDICDSENKVDGVNNCKLVELHLKKKLNKVSFNGSLMIGTGKQRENRCIEGELFLQNKNIIIVDYKIIRLNTNDEHKEYRVLDEFKIQKDIVKRRSQYNYNMISLYDEIEKGKIK